MKHLTLLLFAILSSAVLFGQNAQLTGIVLYQNSGGEPAEGVQISALGANSLFSNSVGMFELKFRYKKAGDRVKVIVGDTDCDGESIRVVNAKQLEHLRIPSDPDEVCEVIVCYSKDFDEAALRYYGIIVKTTEKAYETRLKAIEKELAQDNLNQKMTASLIAQRNKLRVKRDSALRKAEEQAESFASINKDNASELVNEALRKIEEDGDVESALAVLDNAKLEKAYQGALYKKLESEAEIRRVLEGYDFKANLLLAQFRYGEAIECYERIIEIYEANKFDELESAIFYNSLGDLYFYASKFWKAYKYYQKTLDIREKALDPNHPDLAKSYCNLGNVYFYAGGYSKALEFCKKALAIREEVLDPNHPDLAVSYNNLGCIYLNTGEYSNALEYCKKALEIGEKVLDRNHPNLATFYSNTGAAYAETGNFEEAKSAFAIFENIVPENDKGLAYRNWTIYYALQGDTRKALENLEKAVDLGYNDLNWIKTNDNLESIRSDERFKKIIRKLKKTPNNSQI
ncbi:MAG: tetratricopeptide repeat protein [Lewinellaceae bacterium]|nr:tetratricopeptide repeat protein [Lewinellaceae bacterium]